MLDFERLLASWGWETTGTPATASAQQVQQACHFPLPVDYLAFLGARQGFEGELGPQYVHLYSSDEVLETLHQSDSEVTDLLIIGSDGGGEYIALEPLPDNQHPASVRVVLTPCIGDEEEVRVEIGHSFTDFLSRLDAGQPWFDGEEG